MARIAWDKATDRFYDAGLDRGVLYPKTKAAVPWNGLTGVDETGGEAASAYFLDGRPYLYMPRPKEFEASVKAITYPDELSSIMGLLEVADGMYLDGQIGSSFDLSYRTLVGNGVEGLDHGYKIHLVYNAVVTPQPTSYQTLSSDTSPVEFQFVLNALPVVVPGYRPTAHIIIDTRHMAPDKVAQIESLIYGDDNDDTVIDGGTPSSVGSDILDGGLLGGILTDQMDGGTAENVGFGEIDGGSASSPGLGELDGGTSDDSRTQEELEPSLNLLVVDGGAVVEGRSAIQALPNPQIIYDILSFTAGIIITDLGDGTWTAEGAFENVYLTSPGVFRIDNVNAVDHGDGTYTISTTNL